jgi:hypothetical protein
MLAAVDRRGLATLNGYYLTGKTVPQAAFLFIFPSSPALPNVGDNRPGSCRIRWPAIQFHKNWGRSGRQACRLGLAWPSATLNRSCESPRLQGW